MEQRFEERGPIALGEMKHFVPLAVRGLWLIAPSIYDT
jgi:hypothetical protein